MDRLEKIRQLGLELPPCPKPAGSYVPFLKIGSLAYVSGQLPKTPEGKVVSGRVGRDMDLEAGKKAAREAALNVLSVIQHSLGLDQVVRIVKVVGYVNADSNFTEHPQVVNGASDLFLEIFGEAGKHVRSAVGVATLPMNAAVELEVTLQIRE